MSKKILLILILEVGVIAFAYLGFCHHVAGAFGFPLDDSWIHAHFARNIAEGRGIVYNPGQHVSSTALLYSVLLGGMYAVHIAPIFNAILLGLLLHLGASMLIYAAGRKLSLRPVMAGAAAVAFAAIPRLIWGALSGMEVPLYVFLVCLGIYWHVSYSWNSGVRAYLASFAFGLAALARPECAAFMACSLVDRMISCWYAKGNIKRFLLTLPVHLLVFIITIAPVAAYNMASYGKPLPPAFYAKTGPVQKGPTGHRLNVRLDNIKLYFTESMEACRRDNLIALILLLPGVFACVKSKKSGALILLFGILVLPAATGIAAPIRHHRSHAQLTLQHGRYSAYLCPILILMAALGAAEIGDLLNNTRRVKPLFGKVMLAAVGFCAAVLFVSSNCVSVRNYAHEVWSINTMQVALGKWAAKLPKNDALAINDAGAIAYFSGHKIIDTVGVVNPEVVPYLNRYPSREKGLLEYLRERRPDYLIVFPNWYPTLSKRRDILTPIKSVTLKHNIICGGRKMVVYRAKWE